MRYLRLLGAVLVATVLFCSCGGVGDADRLAYQDSKLYIEAAFVLGDESFSGVMTLDTPQYSEDGKMLSRDAVITFGENSIISGVSFEVNGGAVYVSSGTMKIPITDGDVVSGIFDMISLFSISGEHYHSAEKIKVGALDCERVLYVNGENSVEMTLDLSCMLPTKILAEIDGRTIGAEISYIKAE